MKVGDVMSRHVKTVSANDTIQSAARQMADIDAGSLPVLDGETLKGMVTDRDIVVKVIAQGKNPASTPMSELATQDEVVTIGADDPIDEALRTMTSHKVRRLPVIDGHELVGIISQADIATHLEEDKVGELVEAISAAP